MSSVFVTATDTDAGKSFITAGLTRTLIAAGHDVCALKPVSCGRREGVLNEDVAALLSAQGMSSGQPGEINLYDFAEYSAPMFAARAEGQSVNANALADWCLQQCMRHKLTLIEGVGGLMVPLAEGLLVSDWLQLLPDAKVLLVVRARLGGINQALLTLDKLQQMGRVPDWVVVNAADSNHDSMLDEQCEAIASCLGKGASLLSMPFLPQADQADIHLRDSRLFKDLETIATLSA